MKTFYRLNKVSRNKYIDFINRSRVIHRNKHDYSQVIYINSKVNVKIHCGTHNEFFTISPKNYWKESSVGCKRCLSDSIRKRKRLDSNTYLDRFINIHGFNVLTCRLKIALLSNSDNYHYVGMKQKR